MVFYSVVRQKVKIRQTIIEKELSWCGDWFACKSVLGTSIPTTILVFKKNRTTRDVIFIDASNEFEKGKNQNNLSEEKY